MQDTLQTTNHESKAGTFVVGILCGAAVGAAVGLMFAPKRGVDLRNQVSASADRMRRQAAAIYGEAAQAVQDVVTHGRRAVEAGREAFQSVPSSNGVAKDMGIGRS